MRIHISSTPTKPKPAVGDRKVIRGVEHVRVFERAAAALADAGGRDE
jgi:hypothetical protein